jgi:uncharacterized repeat protein (TIGR01451 family)
VRVSLIHRLAGGKLSTVAISTAAAVLLVAGSAAAAQASDFQVTTPELVSGPDPLPSEGLSGVCGQFRSTAESGWRDWEQDNALAVNPTNGANLVSAWIQDFADAIAVGYSTDGGKTWSEAVPKTVTCSWGPDGPPQDSEFSQFGSVIDPWLAFGPSPEADSPEIAYLSSAPQPVPPQAAGSAAIINRSLDGGQSWEDPVVLDRAAFPLVIDTTYVVADPDRAGYAYAKWDKEDASARARNEYLAYTTDGGATPTSWQPLPPVLPSQPGRLLLGGQLLVLADGTLVDIYAELPPQPDFFTCDFCIKGPTAFMARRLANPTDPGSTWSDPITIADPADLDSEAWHLAVTSSALSPDGTIYVGWSRANASASGGSFSLLYSKSTDGGKHWQGPDADVECTAQPPPAGCIGQSIPAARQTGNHGIPMPISLAVSADGTLGAMFADHRNDHPPSSPPKVTDLWLRHSHDRGATWSEEKEPVAGPFDATSAPDYFGNLNDSSGYQGGMLADFNGIAPMANGFATTASLGKEQPEANFALGNVCAWGPSAGETCNTDIFHSYVGDPAADLSLTKADAPDPVSVGGVLTYTLDVKNDGPSSATGVSLTDLLPKRVRLRSVRSDHGRCAQRSPGRVECNLAEISHGETAAVRIEVRPTKAGTIVNTATVGASQPVDLNSANNTATATTEVRP